MKTNKNVVIKQACHSRGMLSGIFHVRCYQIKSHPRMSLSRFSTSFSTHGFTLIELLVVVLIIGILAAVALPQYQVAVTKTKVVRLLPLLRSIELAEQRYFLENGNYTTSSAGLDIDLPAGYKGHWFNVGNEAFQYEDFMCNFASSSVKCRLNNGIILEKNYSTNYIECWADPSNSLDNRVCKSLSGKDFVGTYNPGNKYLISM